MGVEKIEKWLTKCIFKHLVIEPRVIYEWNPVTACNSITVSLFKISPNPAKWSTEDEERIADFLRNTIKISFEEYREIIIEDLKDVLEETYNTKIKEIQNHFEANDEIKELLEELKQLVVENPYLSIEEFERRKPEIIHSRYEYVEREETRVLLDFIEDENDDILFVVGDGGVGKTRLAIEFARGVERQGGWDVSFVHLERNFVAPQIDKDTLIVLDEPSRFKDQSKLFDYIVNERMKGLKLKLLLLERPIFHDSINNTLQEKGAKKKIHILAESPIFDFLKTNYSELGDALIEKIVEEVKDSFVWAAFYAEYAMEEGKVGTFKDVLSSRVSKYQNDIKMATGVAIDDIKTILNLLSLITPIRRDDEKYLEDNLSRRLFDVYEHIRDRASEGKGDFIFPSDGEFAIKPDPLADYLRCELLLDNKKTRNWVGLFLPYMPLRISYNILVLPRYDMEIAQKVSVLLGEIWSELNTFTPKTPEFFDALLLYTGDLMDSPFFDVGKIDINAWLKAKGQLMRDFPEKEIIEPLAGGLMNAIDCFGAAKKLDEMKEALDELRSLKEKFQEKEIRVELTKGLVNAIGNYGTSQKLDEMKETLDELRTLKEKFKEKEIRERLAKGLFNALTDFGVAKKLEEMKETLDELRSLNEEFQEKDIRKLLADGLYNVLTDFCKAQKFDEMKSALDELRSLNEKFQEKEIRELLAKGLFNALNNFGKAQKLDDMNEALNELRSLNEEFQEKEIRVEFAKGLINALSYFGAAQKLEEMKEALDELRSLNEKFQESEIRKLLFRGLLLAAISYNRNNEGEKAKEYLNELYDLIKKYPEDAGEMLQILEELKSQTEMDSK